MTTLARMVRSTRRREHLARRRALECDPNAYISMEVIVGAGLTLLIAALFALAVRQYGTARFENDQRQMLRLAAETELHRLRAGICDPPALETSREEPRGDVTLNVSCQPGVGDWVGFALVRVEASTPNRRGSTASVVLSTYLPHTDCDDPVEPMVEAES